MLVKTASKAHEGGGAVRKRHGCSGKGRKILAEQLTGENGVWVRRRTWTVRLERSTIEIAQSSILGESWVKREWGKD